MRIAEKVTYCASCHGQYLDRQHVDFEAYYDGPSVPNENDTGPNPDLVAIDDLILCKTCLKEAGALVGLVDGEQLTKENEELGEAVEAHLEQVYARDELISDLQRTLEKLTGEKIIRPKRKPRMVEKVS